MPYKNYSFEHEGDGLAVNEGTGGAISNEGTGGG